VSIDLGRRLIAAGVVSPEELEAALFVSVARGVPLPRVLVDRGALSERALEEELERMGGLALRQVTGAPELMARLPRAMCRRLSALPTRVDPATGVVDVAATDPLDPHIAAEIGFHLGAPVRVLRAPIGAVEDAIRRLELDEPAARTETKRPRRVTPAFPHGAPQSSNPPPSMDESPIPLVRKAIGPIDDDRPAMVPRFAMTAPGPAPVYDGAGRRTTPAPFQAVAPAPAPAPPPAPAPTPPAPRVTRASGTLPAVSFPSTPPPDGDRTTPPYGTPAPVLAPPAPPVPRGPRVTPAPETLPPPYGLPAVAAFSTGPLPDVPADLRRRLTPPLGVPAVHGPPSPVTPAPVSPPATSRRAGRPSLSADLPYPGAPAKPDADAGEADVDPPEPRRVRAPNGRPVLTALEVAANRDEIVRLALRGTRLVARRVGVFVVRRDGFHGWTCNVEFGDAEALQKVLIPAEQPSVLATASATPLYLGRIPPTPAHEALLAVMERSSLDVAVVAAKVSGKAAMILIADDLFDTMIGTRFLVELASAVGEALARLISGR
jgi:hypothetical protein